MDRHFVVGCVIAILLVFGCSRSPPDAASAPPAGADQQTYAAPSSDQGEITTLRPKLAPADLGNPSANVGGPTFGFQLAPDLPAQPLEPGTAAPPSDFAAAPPASEIADAPLSATARNGRNPLRLDFDPPTSPPLENPLRASSIAMAPPGDATFAEPPAAGTSPAGGASMDAAPQPLAAAPQSPMPGASSDEAFNVVEVFYGTNRLSSEPGPSDWPSWLLRFVAPGVSLLLTLVVGLVAARRRSFALSMITVAGLACTAGLGYQTSVAAIAAVRRLGTTGPRYTAERAATGHIDLGLCEVTLPHLHEPGELEAPSITRLEILPDAVRHVVLRKTERLPDARFYELLRQRVTASHRKELFVFIHGFNVTFEDAARRTAQIHYDLKFPGAPVFFSWPAHDKFIFTYPADETNVAWSVPHLKKFLLDMVEHSEAQSINLIAHSMGNRALAAALREIDLELRGQSRLFNQVILAAPDIDADDFRHNIAPAMQRTARQMTLYASSRDDALLASQLVHRRPRAGDAGAGLVVVDGIDTIDVTAIDSSPWGHSYYGSSDPVLNDLRELFARAVPPRDRSWLSPAQRDGLTYWVFQAARTAAAATDETHR